MSYISVGGLRSKLKEAEKQEYGTFGAWIRSFSWFRNDHLKALDKAITELETVSTVKDSGEKLSGLFNQLMGLQKSELGLDPKLKSIGERFLPEFCKQAKMPETLCRFFYGKSNQLTSAQLQAVLYPSKTPDDKVTDSSLHQAYSSNGLSENLIKIFEILARDRLFENGTSGQLLNIASSPAISDILNSNIGKDPVNAQKTLELLEKLQNAGILSNENWINLKTISREGSKKLEEFAGVLSKSSTMNQAVFTEALKTYRGDVALSDEKAKTVQQVTTPTSSIKDFFESPVSFFSKIGGKSDSSQNKAGNKTPNEGVELHTGSRAFGR